jgi:molybdate transport system regulatory protein
MTRESQANLVPEATGRAMDPLRLSQLESCFRSWADAPQGGRRRTSRRRVLLIFLLIRYTGAKLSETLGLNPLDDIDCDGGIVLFRRGSGENPNSRQVRIPESLAGEIGTIIDELRLAIPAPDLFRIDPAHVRRKFYERAEASGIPRELGTPEAIRRSRAVELMQGNMPLPVVQKIMGHATPNLAASYVAFSDTEIRAVERFHIDRENRRRTSARNTFFGKIVRLETGDVQAVIEIVSVEGHRVVSAVTMGSQARMHLKPGILISMEVKAPWVVLYKGADEPPCSAENRFPGTVSRVMRGRVNSEVVVAISDKIELCSIVTEHTRRSLAIQEGDTVWAVFNAAMAVVHLDG